MIGQETLYSCAVFHGNGLAGGVVGNAHQLVFSVVGLGVGQVAYQQHPEETASQRPHTGGGVCLAAGHREKREIIKSRHGEERSLRRSNPTAIAYRKLFIRLLHCARHDGKRFLDKLSL